MIRAPVYVKLGSVMDRAISPMMGGREFSNLPKILVGKRTAGCTVVVSGPSGSGKSTLLKRLFQEHPGVFGYSISHTTRSPRSGEENGREYHFVTRPEFEALRAQSAFLEWAEFSRNLYGTSIASVQRVLESGKVCILDIDLQGVQSVKQVGSQLNPRYIFIKPPSFQELRERLVARNTESPESLDLRLKTAEYEMRYAEEHPEFHDVVIVNDDLETAYQQLNSFIFPTGASELKA